MIGEVSGWHVSVQFYRTNIAFLSYRNICSEFQGYIEKAGQLASQQGLLWNSGANNQNMWLNSGCVSAIHHTHVIVTDGVTALEFSVSSRYLAVAGDKHVAVFHNVAGYRSTIAELEERKKSATTAAMRERLQTQIDEARSVLLRCCLCCIILRFTIASSSSLEHTAHVGC